MTVLTTHWPQLIQAFNRDDTLRGHWSFKRKSDPKSKVKIELIISSPFYETWIRLRYATLLAPLESSGLMILRYRQRKKKVHHRPLKGDWNRLVWSILEEASTATQGTYFITGFAGAGKTFLTRQILGSEHSVHSIRSLSRRLGMSKKEGQYQQFMSQMISLPILILDDVHHLFGMPMVSRWLPQLLHLRRDRPLVVLGRPGPGFDNIDPQLKSRFLQSVQGKIDYPDLEARRLLVHNSILHERLQTETSIVNDLCSRPLTPGRLRYIIRCLKTVPQSQGVTKGLVRELLRYAHADDLKLLLRHICFQYGVEAQDLCGKRRPEVLQKAREQYASMALQAGWKPVEVAHILERSSRSVQDLASRYDA